MSEIKRVLIISVLVLVLALLASFFFFPKIIQNELAIQTSNTELPSQEFKEFINNKKSLPAVKDELVLAAVGDLMLSRVVADKISRHGADYPLLKVSNWLKEADVLFGNLETPLTPGRRIVTGEMVFRADPALAVTLKNFNFSILSLANNHTMNFGSEGIINTFSSFDQADLAYVGAGNNELEAGRAKFVSHQGIRLAFLAYNDSDVVPKSYAASAESPGTAFMDIERMTQAVREAKQEADFVVVSVHSGREYEAYHSQRQEEFSRAAIDAGAELVLGHHPHVVQDAEIYKGKLIFYSLGNFVFDQMWSEETKQSLGVKILFTSEGAYQARLYPFIIEDYSQPRAADDKEAEDILERTKLDYQAGLVYLWDEEDNTFIKEPSASVSLFKPEVGNLLKTRTVIDAAGQNNYYELDQGKLVVRKNGSEAFWTSPENWWIEDFSLADINNDGLSDVVMSVWQEDQGEKNFLIINNFSGDQVKTVWESGALASPICRLFIRDFNRDSYLELVVLEGGADDSVKCLSRNLAIWSWNGGGFANIWREEAAGFSKIRADGVGPRLGFTIE